MSNFNRLLVDDLSVDNDYLEYLISLNQEQKIGSIIVTELINRYEIYSVLGEFNYRHFIRFIEESLEEFLDINTIKHIGNLMFVMHIDESDSKDILYKLSAIKDFVHFVLVDNLLFNSINISVNFGIRVVDRELNKNSIVDMINESIISVTYKNSKQRYFYFYNSESDVQNKKQINLFKKSIKNNNLEIVFQPIVDVNSLDIKYYEVLLRARDDEGQHMSIGPLIESAEQEGFIEVIDVKLLEKVASKLKINPNLHLSFNVSASTVSTSKWLNEYLFFFNGDIAKRSVVEITESSDNRNLDLLLDSSNIIRKNGSKVALDDFASCYSTFHELAMIKPDIVKVDGSYVSQVEKSLVYQKFIKFLVSLKEDIPFKLVAEFVDNEHKLNILRSIGVDYVQGFLFPTDQNI